MDRVFAVRLRWGLRHPLTWLWGVLFLGAGLWWHNMPARAELCQWQHLVFWGALALGLFWSEIEIRPLDGWIKKYPAPVLLLLTAGAFAQTEASVNNPFTDLLWTGAVWSCLVALCVYLVLYAILGRIWRAGIAGSAVFTLLSVINFFTLQFRGTPVSPGDIFSAGTAAEVVGGYALSFTPTVLLLCALFVCQLAILLSLRTPGKKRGWKVSLAVRLGCAAVSVLWLWGGYFTALPQQMGLKLEEWSWTVNYYTKGYLCTSVMRIETLFYSAPAGYSDEAVAQMLDEMEPAAQGGGELPNVILIINESWFDWRQVTDFTTNRPVMPFIDSLDNCVRGFAVNPVVGTSASEYEVLTSNSMSLFPSSNPFTQMNLSENNSLARYLGQLGYTSTAFHPCPASNYNRNVVYPALGFDNAYFEGSPEIQDVEQVNVHMGYSDQSCFEVLEMLYEQQTGDQPLFLYNLTFQNHGGYLVADFNGGWWTTDEEHRVYVESGFENVRDEAEEYLTSITYTDEAFEQLVTYFSAQDDPTIICMVGDHPPYFTESVQDGHTGLESTMYQRGTPFIIWANYPIEEENVGYIGMPQLAPLLLQTADIELSPYYQSIVEMQQDVPLLASGFFQTSDGQYWSHTDPDAPTPDTLRRYLYFEYNSVAMRTLKDARLLSPFSLAG